MSKPHSLGKVDPRLTLCLRTPTYSLFGQLHVKMEFVLWLVARSQQQACHPRPSRKR